jgi:UPF0716 protein FxsA
LFLKNLRHALQFILLLFILIPIIEIAVFIQVGDLLGLGPTIAIVIITAVIGVNLLKQQGLKAWSDIQLKMTQGQIPALEMASAAQLLFAGGLLLTPGFVTDVVGFSLMVPAVRIVVAHFLMRRWTIKASRFGQPADFNNTSQFDTSAMHKDTSQKQSSHTIEGEFEDRSK